MSGLFNEASLVLVPSGYKAGKVYSQVPTDGDGDLTFTRASSATRVNSDGLIEKVRTNLLTYSNTFSNAVWSVIGTPTLTANYDTNPLTGANDAWRFVAAGIGHRLVQNISGSNSAFSLYVKGTGQIVIRDNSGTYSFNATLTSSWQRIVVSIPAAFTNIQFTGGSGGCDATIYAAQLEQGDIATDYIPTTTTAVSVGMTANVPRLDYSQGSCPALLLEPQRTNLVTYSEQFDNAAWSKDNVTVTANTATSPDGTQNADTIDDSSASFGSISQLFVSLTNATYTFSVFVKAVSTATNVRLDLYTAVGDQFFVVFNSATGAYVTGNGGVYASTAFNNGWFRFTLTATGSGNTNVRVYPSAQSAASTGAVYVWGAQLEAGSYATSYIPTTSATVTRLADSFTRNNIYTNGLITSSGGTWFVELRNNVAYVRDAIRRFGIGDTQAINLNSLHIGSLSSTSTRQQIFKTTGGGYTLLYTLLTDIAKVAIKWNGTTADVFVNGTKVVSATSFTVTNMEFFKDSGSNSAPLFIQQTALYPTPLEDVDCEVLTGEIYTSYSEMATALGYTII